MVADLIEQHMGSLTKAEMKVANLVVHGDELPALFNIVELAQLADVSESTVSRFCRSLGLSGFAELQQLSRRSVLDRLRSNTPARLQRTREMKGNLDALARTVNEFDQYNLSFYDTIDYDLVEALVGDICSARRVYVMGRRTCKPPASYLAFALNFMRPEVHALLGDLGSDIDRLIGLAEDDLVIAFAVMRYTKHDMTLASTMAGCNPRMYAITDSLLSPLLKLTDNAFLFPNRSLGIVPSLVSMFGFLHFVIAAASIQMNDDELRERLETLESLYSAQGMILEEVKTAGMFGRGRSNLHGGDPTGWSTELYS